MSDPFLDIDSDIGVGKTELLGPVPNLINKGFGVLPYTIIGFYSSYKGVFVPPINGVYEFLIIS